MDTIMEIIRILESMPDREIVPVTPSSILGELCHHDIYVTAEFLFAVEDEYYIEITDAEMQEFSSGPGQIPFGNWSIQQFSDFIDIRGFRSQD